jgi:hypothetical protein
MSLDVTGEGAGSGGSLEHVAAVVVTHRRRRLATEVVRNLIAVEGFAPEHVVLVVNRDGGLDDPVLEAAIRTIRLKENLGPAGGFREGMAAALEGRGIDWVYLCEDDIGLFDLPTPRVARVLQLAAAWPSGGEPLGAIVAYGRRFGRHSGGTDAFVPPADGPEALLPVDVAAWGATLLARTVVDAGVLPDDRWFFGYEDFDFFLNLQKAGFALVVDRLSAVAVGAQMTSAGRDRAFATARPTDAEEAWRAYYVARNFIEVARLHGDARWVGWHLVYSARRAQLAASGAERWATVRGLWDGFRGRLGPNPRYLRDTGEWDAPAAETGTSGPGEGDAAR